MWQRNYVTLRSGERVRYAIYEHPQSPALWVRFKGKDGKYARLSTGQTRKADAIEAAQKADAIVYVLLCADRGFYGGFGYSGEGDMHKLTEQTGGRVINVGNKFDKLREAFDQIAKELRSQYNVGYVPTNLKLDGSYRKLEIKNKQNYKIQARAGYYAAKTEQ